MARSHHKQPPPDCCFEGDGGAEVQFCAHLLHRAPSCFTVSRNRFAANVCNQMLNFTAVIVWCQSRGSTWGSWDTFAEVSFHFCSGVIQSVPNNSGISIDFVRKHDAQTHSTSFYWRLFFLSRRSFEKSKEPNA